MRSVGWWYGGREKETPGLGRGSEKLQIAEAGKRIGVE